MNIVKGTTIARCLRIRSIPHISFKATPDVIAEFRTGFAGLFHHTRHHRLRFAGHLSGEHVSRGSRAANRDGFWR